MYCWPAARARSIKACGLNFVGLNRLGSSRYSASVIPPTVGVMIGQEASTLASEYGPQWMNIPNLALQYQAARSSSEPRAHAKRGVKQCEPAASATLKKSRRSCE